MMCAAGLRISPSGLPALLRRAIEPILGEREAGLPAPGAWRVSASIRGCLSRKEQVAERRLRGWKTFAYTTPDFVQPMGGRESPFQTPLLDIFRRT